MASSVDLFALYANYTGSSESGREEVMNDLTNRSKHFLTMEVSASGRWSLWQDAFDFLGMGMMVDFSRHVGTTDWSSELLKMSVNTPAS